MYKECLSGKGWKVLNSLKNVMKKYHARMAGGTGLALLIGHRISLDLDLFTHDHFRTESVIASIRKSGYPFSIMAEGEGYIVFDIDGIKVSLFHYEYPFLEQPVVFQGILIAGILDIASMKVIAINQRGTKRDFIDLFFLLQNIPFHKVADHMVKRFGPERINPVHIGKSLVFFSDAESNPDPEYLKNKEVKWSQVKKFFTQHVKQFVFDLDSAVKEHKNSV